MITHHGQHRQFTRSCFSITCLIKTTCCSFAIRLTSLPLHFTAALRNLSTRWCELITLPSVWQMEQATSGSLAVAGEVTLISQGLSGPSGSCSGWIKRSTTWAHHVLDNHLEFESGLLHLKLPHYEELSWSIVERIGRIEQMNIKRTKGV